MGGGKKKECPYKRMIERILVVTHLFLCLDYHSVNILVVKMCYIFARYNYHWGDLEKETDNCV